MIRHTQQETIWFEIWLVCGCVFESRRDALREILRNQLRGDAAALSTSQGKLTNLHGLGMGHAHISDGGHRMMQ